MRIVRVFRTAKRIIFSRFFLISAVLWIFFTFIITVFSVGVVADSSTINQFSIPDSQTAGVLQFSGSNLTFYGQNFNAYGNGIPGTSVYYNLSGSQLTSGSELMHITGGYAGKTNNTGFIRLNISGVYANYEYFLYVHYFNSNSGYNLSTSYFVSPATSQQSTSSRSVAVTPVLSDMNNGTFALHIWTLSGTTMSNATVFYERGPSLSTFFSTPSLFDYNKTVTIAKVTLSTPVNLQTDIPLHGQPYFYAVGINSSNGANAGQTLFSTFPTPLEEAHQVSGAVFGISFLIIFFISIASVFALSIPDDQKKSRLERIVPYGFPDDGSEERGPLFIHRILTSMCISIPVIAITIFFAYLASVTTFNTSPSIVDFLIYSVAMLMMIVLGTSYASILLGTKIIRPVHKDDKNFRRYVRRIYIFVYLLFIPLFYGFFTNYEGIISSNPYPSLTVLGNFISPFSYSYLILQRVNKSLFFWQPYSINPSTYGVTYASVAIMGIIWIAVWVLLPYLLFRVFPGKITSSENVEGKQIN